MASFPGDKQKNCLVEYESQLVSGFLRGWQVWP